MQRPSYLKPILITTTVIHAAEAGLGIIASLFGAFFFAALFRDTPSAPSSFPAVLGIILVVILIVPVGFTLAQWLLYRAHRDRAALIVSLIGVAPLLLSILNMFRS